MIKAGDFYEKEYIDEQIEDWGEICEYDDGLLVCPYCGKVYDTSYGDVEYGEYEDEERKCENCNNTFLLTYAPKTYDYFTTKRKED